MLNGSINIPRNIWQDPTFPDEPISQREAWIYMLAEASWRNEKKNIGGRLVELKRGQFVAASRFLAKAWNWTETKVRRFLKSREGLGAIVRNIDARITVVTICNYDEIQNASLHRDATVTQERCEGDANLKKEEIISGGGGALPLEVNLPVSKQGSDDPEVKLKETFRDRLLAAMGCDCSGVINANGKMIGTEADMLQARSWQRDLNLTEEQIIEVIQGAMVTKTEPGPPFTFKYFTKAMQRYAKSLLDASNPIEPLPRNKHSTSNRKGKHDGRITFAEEILGFATELSEGKIQFGVGKCDPFAG